MFLKDFPILNFLFIGIILSSVKIRAQCSKPADVCKNFTHIQNQQKIYQDLIINCSNCLNQSGIFTLRNYTNRNRNWSWGWECFENKNQRDFSNYTIILRNELEPESEISKQEDFDGYLHQHHDYFNETETDRLTLLCQESFKRNNLSELDFDVISRTNRRQRKNEITMGNVLLFLSGVSIGVSALFVLLCFCQKKIKENWKAPRRDLL